MSQATQIEAVGPVAGQFASAGKVPALERVRVVLVYDEVSGQVVQRNVALTFQGAEALGDDALLAHALDSARAATEALQAAAPLRARADGRRFCPPAQMRAVLSTDPAHAEADCHVDPASGRIIDDSAPAATP